MLRIFWNNLQLYPVVLGIILTANATISTKASATEVGIDIVNITDNKQLETPATIVQKNVDSIQIAQTSVTDTANVQETTEVLEQVNRYSNQGNHNSLSQVTSVSQFSDVQPTDWAFQALQSLVERYGCIAGYPNGTYRGNRPMTRYEFAAGLNACLDRVSELIATATAQLVTKEDLAILQRLQEEFSPELATLRGRVDTLEAHTAQLEANQFSTTTKLVGEAIFTIADTFGDQQALPSSSTANNPDLNTNIIFGNRIRLNFLTSFTGKDRLQARLQARNITQFGSAVTGTNMTRLGYDGNENNSAFLQKLEYRFPLTSQAVVYVSATGGEFNDNMFNFNPGFDSSGNGALSRFGRFNPIYRESAEGTGATFTYNFNKALALSLGYMTRPGVANNPAQKFGLDDGSYAALAQLAFRPNDVINLGFTYVHSYYNSSGGVQVSGTTGSAFANQPFGNVATSANHYGIQANFRFNPKISLSGWVGYTTAIAEDGTPTNVTRGDSANIWNWAATLGVSDIGSKGSLLGFVFGMPPKVTDNDVSLFQDRDTSYHLEAFYRYRMTDNIAITPGAFVIFNPEHNSNNNNIYVGAMRVTFSF
ncbi:iron uptake porin [Iningainema tapete]|uniref:Iron uptake porin n=1 Tax=Iningainema tapete BLCC-T55 TaxID=2748662 RepID=A0A8J6XGG4_9CYAN|nr:iron uptake porin [Iningainema tapete]MBD2772705.1 iron uptake porin [Iningainema tapete BLCC-T55]